MTSRIFLVDDHVELLRSLAEFRPSRNGAPTVKPPPLTGAAPPLTSAVAAGSSTVPVTVVEPWLVTLRLAGGRMLTWGGVPAPE